MSYERDQIDLTNCDREPIHIPGSIQPHGAMLVVDPLSNKVAYASTNVADYLGGQPGAVIGLELPSVLGVEVAHQIGNAAAMAGAGHIAGVVLSADIGRGRKPVDITIHKYLDRVFVELEPPASSDDTETALTLTQSLVRRIDRESEVDSLVKSVARLLRAMLGYDRVMVYRFLHNGAGRVVAEARAPQLQSFLGQHFPVSDIPAQARRLYLHNWIRVIGDVSFVPVPLTPGLPAGDLPVDMSYAHLRSVSLIHCQYLSNMGVASSMSISIVVNGELWGLIACHHDTPKVLSIPLRVATELFAQYFSLQIAAAENRQKQKTAASTRHKLNAIIAAINPADSMEITLKARLREFSSLVACDGAALWLDGEWTTTGAVPSGEDVAELMALVTDKAGTQVWETQDLKSALPQSAAYGHRVAGLMAIPVSMTGNNYFVFFRSEEAYEIEWAGEPRKEVVSTPTGDRLTPRGSFETWREDVRNKSVPWSSDDLVVAEAIRSYVRDMLLRHNDATEEQRTRTENQRKLLNAELNHRVKNILALVKSIAAQTGASAGSVDEYASSFEGRLRALSYAHDQTFAGKDGGELRPLIASEASMHLSAQRPDRFAINGPTVGLSEQAFGAFALLLHEMMTNAAKYGSLSTPEGRLQIEWTLLGNGDCRIDWIESGGPPVVPPTRTGFGSTLIERTVTFDLGGKVDLFFEPEGLRARFVIPATHLRAVTAEAIETPLATNNSQPLTGLTVMLVEDQALIALDTEEMLRELGASEIRSLPNVELALQTLAMTVPDCAVLDLRLGEDTSEMIATELASRNIPFVFATGYRDSVTIPEQFSSVPVVRKPVSQGALSRQLSLAMLQERDRLTS